MFTTTKLRVKQRIERFIRWKLVNYYKLWYALRCIRPYKLGLLYAIYILCVFLLGFLNIRNSLNPLNERLYKYLNNIAKSIISRNTKVYVKYRVKGNTIAFLVSDLEGIEIMSPVFEYTNMKLLFYYIKKFNGRGVLIDGGSHVGKYAVTFAKLFPHLNIIAIEPDKLNYLHLLYNTKINNLQNIIPINKALYSREGKVQLSSSEYSGRHRIFSDTMYRGPTKIFLVEATTLDNVIKNIFPQLLEQGCVDFPIIIKIDVEGAEQHVISGSYFTLSTCKNIVLLVEVWQKDVLKELNKMGMRCINVHEVLTKTNTNYALCVKS